ncbi:type II toxin-antitoxin system Phd/YefM family antitoxin [Natronoglycomyces albus]|uniref:Antitoxin n=1 Tax=Natronoglycomyces albus TaxID=2811108 RepID=A0A895XUD3_9ACTN|nr:type II toxin-antitoxin system prevent-host-death family antitoxin [Natronoglycomyces albus]QSB05268.1 type II toxin-antitoxin system prevent-host-death family antitoxin [Natronoglycomyces albus]
MKLITVTEASRHFAATINEVERGETIIITRGGQRVAKLVPTPKVNGGEFLKAMADFRQSLDEHREADVRSAREAVDHDSRNLWDDE